VPTSESSRTSTPTPTPEQTSLIVSPTARPTTDTSSPPDNLTPTIWPTVTRQILSAEAAAGLVPCAQRTVEDSLLVTITQQFGLPESYAPPDLVPLSTYFSSGVTVGIDSYVRTGLIEPLQRMLADMHAAGLEPSILSGYRSYSEQYLAWKWWNSQYPERVAIMSARAGHSEHQLGTTVDFGSPALDHLFHVDFATTPEGVWLAGNAHRYGFTMSYPADTYDITGFKYEPWHYRYVGVEMSTELYNSAQTLTEWQLAALPPPCLP
jgi:D-alanyl-D-alanine carboxypeptidase